MTRHAPPPRGDTSGVRPSNRLVAVPDGRLQLALDGPAGEPAQLQVAGELDLAGAPRLAAELEALDGPIRLDLSGVTFIDLAGLRVLLEAHARDRRLHIVAASDACERLLELTRAGHLLRPD